MARYLGRDHSLHQLERIAKAVINPGTTPKMGKTTIAVGAAADLHHATADQAMKSINKKDHGAWRYPNNRIVRHEGAVFNGTHYYDERDPDLPRRKIESNFFITLNTNRQFKKAKPQLYAAGMTAMENTLRELAMDETIKQYLAFGPRSAWYADDRYDDVVESVEFTGRAETGELKERLHVHIWLTIKHYSQLQIHMKLMQHQFKAIFNKHIAAVSGSTDNVIKSLPYIQVKLLPTSDWAMVLQQYIQKGMHASDGPGPAATVQRNRPSSPPLMKGAPDGRVRISGEFLRI